MINLGTIVGHVGGRCKEEYEEQNDWRDAPASSAEVKSKIKQHLGGLFDFVEKQRDQRTFDEVERGLKGLIFTLARLFLAYYMARRHEASGQERRSWKLKGYRSCKPQRKHLNTFFGRVTFWRTYVRRSGGSGLHPLDLALGLTADGFSLLTMEMCARLSTLVSYEQVTALMLYFLDWSPSKTTVEKSVLGLGEYTQNWFEGAPPPPEWLELGAILVIQIDSKATPTATEEELDKRRGKRKKNKAASPRHRGRQKRAGCKKKRRKSGDKSKNGKATTLIVMYTLQPDPEAKGKKVLLGPVRKKVYASYGTKKHAFAIARREADKCGFTVASKKQIQLITDGDEDLERYAKDFFPGAEHTLDIFHALEYVWEAGRLFLPQGSEDLTKWVKIQEDFLYCSNAEAVVNNVAAIRNLVSPAQTKRLDQIREYLAKRTHMMQYGRLRRKDLDIGSGMVEGAVKHVIGKRFDNGSMRWIRERAEALLQLRCIEINGDWAAFIRFVEERVRRESASKARPGKILKLNPSALPTFREAS